MRTFSPSALRSIYALETGEAYILLATITDPTTGQNYYTALNTVDVVSRGITFTACYFQFTFAEDSDEAPQGCQITMDNVDLRLVGLLRSVTKPLQLKIESIVAQRPDQVEMQITDLIMREVTWDASTIQATLISDDPLNSKFPGDIYEPRTFGGLF